VVWAMGGILSCIAWVFKVRPGFLGARLVALILSKDNVRKRKYKASMPWNRK